MRVSAIFVVMSAVVHWYVLSAYAETPVVLLHGLARSSSSLSKAEAALTAAGYKTCNISYPSTKYPINVLLEKHVLPAIKSCTKLDQPVAFVTHSLGGIIVRALGRHYPEFPIGRVVMLSPPNHGSEIVDKLGSTWLFYLINGPAGSELGTDSKSIPNMLGKPRFEFAVITGDLSWNPIFSSFVRGEDDGKVSVASAQLEGMKDFRIVSASHTFIMNNPTVIAHTLNFLKKGRFE